MSAHKQRRCVFGCDSLVLRCNGQLAENNEIYFQKFKMDLEHRGTFNMSPCSSDLINCWEFIKPDIICAHWVYHESVCGGLRDLCDDVYYNQDVYSLVYTVQESFCRKDDYSYYRRRRMGASRRSRTNSRLNASARPLAASNRVAV